MYTAPSCESDDGSKGEREDQMVPVLVAHGWVADGVRLGGRHKPTWARRKITGAGRPAYARDAPLTRGAPHSAGGVLCQSVRTS